MMNEAHISLTGYVASQPRLRPVRDGVQVVSMRVAWTPRRLDRATGEWADGSTSYVTVTCWRKLAENVGLCLRKGDPVVVKGRLSVRTYDDKEGVTRTQVEVDATSVGHDLCRGVAHFQRTRPPTGQTAAEYATSLNVSTERGYGAEPGAAELDETAEPGALTGTEPAYGDDGQASPEIFDEEGIAALAAEPVAAAAPF
jgi:single-strand DNA-binding protein